MATVRRTRALEQKRFEETRRRDDERHDLIRKVQADRVTVANASSDARVDYKRRQRQLAQEKEERDFIAGLEADAQRAEEIKRRQAQEEALASAVEKLELERLRDEKFRAQIRETAPELRELEAKLRAGYTSMELRNQIEARERAAEEETRRMRETAREMAETGGDYEEEERLETMRRMEKSRRYQAELDEQLAIQETQRREAYAQFQRDKTMIDEIVLKIQAEDEAEARRERERKQMTLAEQEAFESAREEHQRALREQMRREDEEIARQAAEAARRESERKAAKAGERAALEELQAQMGADAARIREEQEEMDRVRQELYEEEMRVALEQRARADEAKRARMRDELMAERAAHLERSAQRREEEAREEEAFRAAMMDKFAREDRLEQMSAQKARMKALEHRRETERLIEERRAQRAAEAEAEEREAEDARARETLRAEVVEQERRRMLREHAVKLLGFLPKGVIQGEDDLELLGGEFKERYTRHADDDGW